MIEYQNKTDAHLVKHKQHKTQCETLGGKLKAWIFYPKKKFMPSSKFTLVDYDSFEYHILLCIIC